MRLARHYAGLQDVSGAQTVSETLDQHEVTIRSDGSVGLPRTLLKRLGWQPGDDLILVPNDAGALSLHAPQGRLVSVSSRADTDGN